MWIFCCGMYRSASTLQFQITTQLVERAGIGQRVGWIDALRFAEVREAHAGYLNAKVIKVHQFHEEMAEEFRRNNARGIYSYRDLRDVFASMMKQQQASFDAIWNWQGCNFIEACLNNYKKWTSLPNVLVSEYTQVVNDIPKEIRRIAQYLDLTISPSESEELAASLTIKKQQERMQQFATQLLQTSIAPTDHRKLVDFHDETTLLHMNHIDSAKSGRWHNDLTMEQVAHIEAEVRRWCQLNHYDPAVFLHECCLIQA